MSDKPKPVGTMAFGDNSVIDIHKVETENGMVKMTNYNQEGESSFIVYVPKEVFNQMYVEDTNGS